MKRGLCSFDDKRFVLDDGINTLAYGHKDITKKVESITVGNEIFIMSNEEAVRLGYRPLHLFDPTLIQPRRTKQSIWMTRRNEQVVKDKDRIIQGLSMIDTDGILDDSDSDDEDAVSNRQTIKEDAANSDNNLPFNTSPHFLSDDTGSDDDDNYDSDTHLSNDDGDYDDGDFSFKPLHEHSMRKRKQEIPFEMPCKKVSLGSDQPTTDHSSSNPQFPPSPEKPQSLDCDLKPPEPGHPI